MIARSSDVMSNRLNRSNVSQKFKGYSNSILMKMSGVPLRRSLKSGVSRILGLLSNGASGFSRKSVTKQLFCVFATLQSRSFSGSKSSQIAEKFGELLGQNLDSNRSNSLSGFLNTLSSMDINQLNELGLGDLDSSLINPFSEFVESVSKGLQLGQKGGGGYSNLTPPQSGGGGGGGMMYSPPRFGSEPNGLNKGVFDWAEEDLNNADGLDVADDGVETNSEHLSSDLGQGRVTVQAVDVDTVVSRKPSSDLHQVSGVGGDQISRGGSSGLTGMHSPQVSGVGGDQISMGGSDGLTDTQGELESEIEDLKGQLGSTEVDSDRDQIGREILFREFQLGLLGAQLGLIENRKVVFSELKGRVFNFILTLGDSGDQLPEISGKLSEYEDMLSQGFLAGVDSKKVCFERVKLIQGLVESGFKRSEAGSNLTDTRVRRLFEEYEEAFPDRSDKPVGDDEFIEWLQSCLKIERDKLAFIELDIDFYQGEQAWSNGVRGDLLGVVGMFEAQDHLVASLRQAKAELMSDLEDEQGLCAARVAELSGELARVRIELLLKVEECGKYCDGFTHSEAANQQLQERYDAMAVELREHSDALLGLSSELDEKQNELNDALNEKAELVKSRSDDEARISELDDRIESLVKENQALIGRVHELEDELSNLKFLFDNFSRLLNEGAAFSDSLRVRIMTMEPEIEDLKTRLTKERKLCWEVRKENRALLESMKTMTGEHAETLRANLAEIDKLLLENTALVAENTNNKGDLFECRRQLVLLDQKNVDLAKRLKVTYKVLTHFSNLSKEYETSLAAETALNAKLDETNQELQAQLGCLETENADALKENSRLIMANMGLVDDKTNNKRDLEACRQQLNFFVIEIEALKSENLLSEANRVGLEKSVAELTRLLHESGACAEAAQQLHVSELADLQAEGHARSVELALKTQLFEKARQKNKVLDQQLLGMTCKFNKALRDNERQLKSIEGLNADLVTAKAAHSKSNTEYLERCGKYQDLIDSLEEQKIEVARNSQLALRELLEAHEAEVTRIHSENHQDRSSLKAKLMAESDAQIAKLEKDRVLQVNTLSKKLKDSEASRRALANLEFHYKLEIESLERSKESLAKDRAGILDELSELNKRHSRDIRAMKKDNTQLKAKVEAKVTEDLTAYFNNRYQKFRAKHHAEVRDFEREISELEGELCKTKAELRLSVSAMGSSEADSDLIGALETQLTEAKSQNVLDGEEIERLNILIGTQGEEIVGLKDALEKLSSQSDFADETISKLEDDLKQLQSEYNSSSNSNAVAFNRLKMELKVRGDRLTERMRRFSGDNNEMSAAANSAAQTPQRPQTPQTPQPLQTTQPLHTPQTLHLGNKINLEVDSLVGEIQKFDSELAGILDQNASEKEALENTLAEMKASFDNAELENLTLKAQVEDISTRLNETERAFGDEVQVNHAQSDSLEQLRVDLKAAVDRGDVLDVGLGRAKEGIKQLVDKLKEKIAVLAVREEEILALKAAESANWEDWNKENALRGQHLQNAGERGNNLVETLRKSLKRKSSTRRRSPLTPR